MRAAPLRAAHLRTVPSGVTSHDKRVAVLLNAHARKVDHDVIRALGHIVPEDDLFVSHSELDARRIAQTVVERQYPTVLTGGGDGTFMGFANAILNEKNIHPSTRAAYAPRFGVLKLGTGNALATMLHASPMRGDGYLDDVLRARSGEIPSIRRVDLLQVNGKRAPFAGMGLDGRILNDYVWLKEHVAVGPLRQLLTGSRGYFASVALRTIPHYVSQRKLVQCEVINSSSQVAYRLGSNGLPVGPHVGPGETLFSGSLMLLCAGTVPYFGYGFKMFPFAGQRRRMMHLRLGTVDTAAILANLPKVWAGKWFPKEIYDFHADSVTIRCKQPMPLQVGGDAEGYCQEVTFSIAPEQLEMLDFAGAAN